MKSFTHKSVLAAVLLFPFILSCSVKENRSVCPCYLNVNIDAYAVKDEYPAVMVQVRGRSLIQNIVVPDEYGFGGYEIKVPRCISHISVIGGLQNSIIDGDTLRIVEGKEPGPLFMFNDVVDCNGEVAFSKALPKKKWCDIHIILVGEKTAENFEHDIILSAECNALCISSGLPIAGEYKVPVRRLQSGNLVVSIPRQKSNTLKLEFFEKDEEQKMPVYDLNVGCEMEKQGYDWNKDILDDVNIYVDYAKLSVDVNVVEWDIAQFNIEI